MSKPEVELSPEELRWRCDPAWFEFRTTAELEGCPIHIIGQDRAREALAVGLAEITGFAAVSLQPNAGSQGEYAGLLVIRAYH